MRDVFSVEMSYKYSPNALLIEKFADSGYDVCEVEYDTNKYTDTGRLAVSLSTTAKRYGKPHIKAIAYRNKLYLMNRLKGR